MRAGNQVRRAGSVGARVDACSVKCTLNMSTRSGLESLYYEKPKNSLDRTRRFDFEVMGSIPAP